MKSFWLGVLAGVIGVVAVFWKRAFVINEIVFDIDDETVLNEHEEAQWMDEQFDPSEGMVVRMHAIHLGDLSVLCAICDEEVDQIHVGLGSVEDRNSDDGDFNNVQAVACFVFGCAYSHTVFSACLVDQAAKLLDAEENGKIRPELLVDLGRCEEHANADEED